MSPKIVTVYGATGTQGGSVARSLLANKAKAFAVRAITRNPTSDGAKALAEAGAEVVKADGLSKEEMAVALKGSWAVFVNTNSDDPSLGQEGGPTETHLGKGIVDAAAEAGVEVFVYSGMASATEVTKGNVPALAFDEKHAIGEYAKAKPFKCVAIVSPGWYMENFLVEQMAPLFGGFPFIPNSEGSLTFSCPRWGGTEEVPFIAIGADYGDLVHGVLLEPEKYNRSMVHGLSSNETVQHAVRSFEKVTGKKSKFVPMEDWKELPTYGLRPMETVRDMFGFCQFSGGLYYGAPNDEVTPAELKKAAAEAQGKTGEEARLMTMEQFFKLHFAS